METTVRTTSLFRRSKQRRGATIAMLQAVLMMGACFGESARTAAGPGITDVDTLPVSHPIQVQRFGSSNSPDSGFTRLHQVVVDENGRLYAADEMDLRIRVYSPTNEFLRLIGRSGEGPGEFQGPPMFGVRGDSLWAYDMRNARLTLFRPDGQVLSTAKVTSVEVPIIQPPGDPRPWVGTLAPVRMRPDGLLLSSVRGWRPTPDAPQPATDTLLNPRVLFDMSGRVVDTVGWYPAEELPGEPGELIQIEGQYYDVPLPPSDRPLRLLLDDGEIVVDRHVSADPLEDTFSVTRLTFSADTVYHRVFKYRPVGYSEAVLDSMAWRNSTPAVSYAGSTPSAPSGPARRRIANLIREEMRFPDHQLPVRTGLVGGNGEVWLQREDRGGPDHQWLVLDSAGRARTMVQLPQTVQPKWVTGDRMYGATTDPLGIPWVVEFQISSMGRHD